MLLSMLLRDCNISPRAAQPFPKIFPHSRTRGCTIQHMQWGTIAADARTPDRWAGGGFETSRRLLRFYYTAAAGLETIRFLCYFYRARENDNGRIPKTRRRRERNSVLPAPYHILNIIIDIFSAYMAHFSKRAEKTDHSVLLQLHYNKSNSIAFCFSVCYHAR